jgi:hypothetical protein
MTERIDRVVITGGNIFTILFADHASRERLFADEEYRAVRARWFAPSVGAVEVLEEGMTFARPSEP